MNGIDITLGGSVATSPFGKAHPFEGIYDSTIMLWDSQFNPETGVPANGSRPVNLVADRLATLSGLSGDDLNFKLTNTSGNGFVAAERTTKGGLHIASTQAGAQNAASFIMFGPTDPLQTWLASNEDAGADYATMLSVWFRKTRSQITPDPNAPQAISWIVNSSGATSNFYGHTQGLTPAVGVAVDDGASPAYTGHAGMQAAAALGAPGVISFASKGWFNTKANLETVFASVGANGAWTGFNYNKAPSGIIYRIQVDLLDLSEVSGTVGAKAAALLAEQNAMLARDFAIGGRFYNDGYTLASTLKP